VIAQRTAWEGAVTLAEDFGSGQAFLSILWFFLFFIWIWLLIVVFGDIFRSRDMGGWAKGLWVIFVIVLPYLGVFVYLIARGHKMGEHAVEAAKEQEAAQRAYIQNVAGTASSPADEIARLADLKNQGAISDAEFERLKAKVVSS
jgi:Short C-terminal domain/Phospholipase_D-nuclease N-terminal